MAVDRAGQFFEVPINVLIAIVFQFVVSVQHKVNKPLFECQAGAGPLALHR